MTGKSIQVLWYFLKKHSNIMRRLKWHSDFMVILQRGHSDSVQGTRSGKAEE